MKKILLALTATFAVCLAVFAGKNMCVKKQNGDILRINVDDVYEVYFENIFNPDTSSIIPPFIEPTVADTSAYAPLRFRITSDFTVELAYGNYRDLDSVNIPAKVKIGGKVYSVTSIGSYVFSSCSSLTSIEIPSSVTSIGSGAFSNCRSLTSIEIPSSVTSIGESVFSNCSSLTSIEIPSSVTSIGEWAFSSCSNLTSIEIPSSVTSIGLSAFGDCSSLTEIIIPSSVTEIGSGAFFNCKNLDVVIDNSKVDSKLFGWKDEGSMVNSGVFRDVHSVKWLRKPNPSGEDVSAYSPLLFKISSDSTVELYQIDYSYDDLDSVLIPAKVKIDGKLYSVTSISGAFRQYHNQLITYIGIPESVTSIVSYAFYGCSSLESINVDAKNPNYSSLDGILYNKDKTEIIKVPSQGVKGSYSISSSVTSIGSLAFEGCSSLTSVEIPSSVTEIGSEAFYGCSKLKPEVLIYDNGTKCYGWIGDKASCISVVIPSSVTSIGSRAFEDCSSLTSVEIPSSVTEIGEYAFSGCKDLDVVIDNSKENVKFYDRRGEETTMEGNNAFKGVKSVKWLKEKDEDPSVADVSAYAPLRFEITSDSTVELTRGENWDSYEGLDSVNIPAKVKIDGKIYDVTRINNWAFYWCDSLKSIIIPESITSIGSGAFTGCQRLTSIEIPASVTSIADSTFASCSGLKTIVIPESVTSIKHQTFWECSSLESIIIPESITEIEERTFHGCSSLTTIVIPKSINKISYGLFENCSNLTAIEIPSNVTEIGSEAFSGCSSLTSIEIPSSVTEIGLSAFSGCSSLTSIDISSNVTEIGLYAFYGCKNLDVVIDNSKDNIKFYGWGKETTMEESKAFEGVKSVNWLK